MLVENIHHVVSGLDASKPLRLSILMANDYDVRWNFITKLHKIIPDLKELGIDEADDYVLISLNSIISSSLFQTDLNLKQTFEQNEGKMIVLGAENACYQNSDMIDYPHVCMIFKRIFEQYLKTPILFVDTISAYKDCNYLFPALKNFQVIRIKPYK